MKLTQLASKPQLVKLTIDDEKIVEKYGEAIEFWVYDRQNMETFMRLARLEDGNIEDIAVVMTDMILDEQGNKIVADDNILPSDIMIKAIEKVVSSLGNGVNQTSVA
jgi:hypothetical protein